MIDTSALIAILLQQSTAERIVSAVEVEPNRKMSAASLVEAGIVMQARQGDEGERELDALVHRLQTLVVPVTEEQAELARAAFRRYGKGRHPAALNFRRLFLLRTRDGTRRVAALRCRRLRADRRGGGRVLTESVSRRSSLALAARFRLVWGCSLNATTSNVGASYPSPP